MSSWRSHSSYSVRPPRLLGPMSCGRYSWQRRFVRMILPHVSCYHVMCHGYSPIYWLLTKVAHHLQFHLRILNRAHCFLLDGYEWLVPAWVTFYSRMESRSTFLAMLSAHGIWGSGNGKGDKNGLLRQVRKYFLLCNFAFDCPFFLSRPANSFYISYPIVDIKRG